MELAREEKILKSMTLNLGVTRTHQRCHNTGTSVTAAANVKLWYEGKFYLGTAAFSPGCHQYGMELPCMPLFSGSTRRAAAEMVCLPIYCKADRVTFYCSCFLVQLQHAS